MLAPIGWLESIVAGGAATAGRGAAEFGVPQMLSSVCQPGLEETAAAAETLRIFQLYVRGDDAWVDDYVRRAKDNGYSAFCLTVDIADYSRRERDLAGRFVKPWRAARYRAAISRPRSPGTTSSASRTSTTCRSSSRASPRPRMRSSPSSTAWKWSTSPTTAAGSSTTAWAAAVLPEIVEAVRGRAEVWVDGGFMRGTDVVKAIALGAKAVGIGRLAGLASPRPGGRAWCARWKSSRTRSASASACSASLPMPSSAART